MTLRFAADAQYSAYGFGIRIIGLLDLMSICKVVASRYRPNGGLGFATEVEVARQKQISIVGAHYGSPIEVIAAILGDAALLTAMGLAITKAFKTVAETGEIRERTRVMVAEREMMQNSRIDKEFMSRMVSRQFDHTRTALANELSGGDAEVFREIYSLLDTERGDRLIVTLGTGVISIEISQD